MTYTPISYRFRKLLMLAFANGLQKVSRNFATDNSGQEAALPYPCPSAKHLIIYIGEYETDLSDYGGLRELREPD